MNGQTFIDAFGHIAEAPGGIHKLRRLIRDLAVRGLLSGRDDSDEPVQDLLERLESKRKLHAGGHRMRTSVQRLSVSTVDAPFTLPPQWRWVGLGDVVSDIHLGLTAKASDDVLEPAFVRITDIKNSQIQWQGVPGCVNADSDVDRFLLASGDILIARSGATVGVSTVVKERPRKAVFASYLIRLVPLEPWLSAWWPILAGSGFYWSQVDRIKTGSAQPNINSTNMRSWLVPLPPLQEQQRIMDRVEELTGLCDELEAQQAARTEARTGLTSATLHRLCSADSANVLREALAAFADSIGIHLAPGDGDLAALKELRQTIIDLAVRGRLTHQDPNDRPAAELLEQISVEYDRMVKAKEMRKPRARASFPADEQNFAPPAGWVWASLGQLVLATDSGWSPACLPSRRTDDSQWGVLKVSAVSWGDFRADEHKLLTPGLAPRPQIEVQDGDFLMSRANTSELVGRSVVVTDPPPRLMLSDKHVRLRFLDRITAAYVNLVNGSSRARGYYASVGTGTSDSMRNITREQILALPIPVPPIAEQERIVSVVNVLRSHCDELEQQLLDAQSRRRGLSESVAARVVALAG